MTDLHFDVFPHGKRKSLVMSYDDGVVEDRPLVEIFNRYGIKGTFHLNSGFLDRSTKLRADEVKSLYEGHEVSVHTVSHPNLPHLSNERIIGEIIEDRKALESLVGYPVRGMSYPGGGFDDRVVAMLPMLGIEYARTTHNAGFGIPQDWLRWPATCHHRDALAQMEKFNNIPARWGLQLFYVWGHSYEFDRQNNWDLIETFCKEMGGHDDVWYATQIEVVDYMNAIKQLRCSADSSMVWNPSAMSVWVAADSEIVEIAPGETKYF